MTPKVFFEVVEIRTKVASVIPFIIGVLFSLTFFQQVHIWKSLLFFAGMIIFDMATTAINNYMDFKKAKSAEYKFEENIIGMAGISDVIVRNMIFAMVLFTLFVGVILAVQTGWLFLLMGGACCFIGIFYTFGPIPLSRMPLGELFSGFTMGLGIFAMTIYLNTYDLKAFYLTLTRNKFLLEGNLWSVLAIVVASLPMVFTIANIMLGNNLRDLDRDIENHRYTLVFYIGRSKGLLLFQLLNYGCYLIFIIGLLMRIYPWPIIFTFLSLPLVHRNVRRFLQESPQPKSFGYTIKNLLLLNGSYILGLVIGILV